jgi:cytidylate kinase
LANIPHIPVITIDGPVGSGKGSIALMLAQTLHWHLLDSGVLYRVLGLSLEKHGVDPEDEPAVEHLAQSMDVHFQARDIGEPTAVILEGEDVTPWVRTERSGELASQISAFKTVRAALLARQRAFRRVPGLIADGRDMGTVVFPDADLKIFLTATQERRAERRLKQLKDKQVHVTLAALLEDIRLRDERDTYRAISPLAPAADARVLDSTDLGLDIVYATVMSWIHQRLPEY